MTTPVLHKVESSYLNRAGYDPDKEEFFVEFKDGKVWRYFEVTAEENQAFWDAESQGKFFIAHFKKGKKCGPVG